MGRLEAGMQEAEDRLKQAGGLLISSVETYVETYMLVDLCLSLSLSLARLRRYLIFYHPNHHSTDACRCGRR